MRTTVKDSRSVIKLYPIEQDFDEELKKVSLWFDELRDNQEIESQHETPMLPGNYLAEVNTTNKSNDFGIETKPFYSAFASEWENHALSMASISQAFPTATNNFSKSLDLHLNHETEQQDMAATCMMGLPDTNYDEENHYQQFQSSNHLPYS